MEIIGNVITSPFWCLGWIIVGAVAGAIARQVMGARDKPFINDLILGLVGAFIGGFVAGLLGFTKPEGGISLVVVNLIVATIGAVIIIAIGRAILGRR